VARTACESIDFPWRYRGGRGGSTALNVVASSPPRARAFFFYQFFLLIHYYSHKYCWYTASGYGRTGVITLLNNASPAPVPPSAFSWVGFSTILLIAAIQHAGKTSYGAPPACVNINLESSDIYSDISPS
jgi:hypothetical protein